MSQSVSLSVVERMMKECAPGSTWRTATHSFVVTYLDRVYRSVPRYQEIEIGYVRKLVRHLKVDKDCAKKHIPAL